jgi:hypothetical protein
MEQVFHDCLGKVDNHAPVISDASCIKHGDMRNFAYSDTLYDDFTSTIQLTVFFARMLSSPLGMVPAIAQSENI